MRRILSKLLLSLVCISLILSLSSCHGKYKPKDKDESLSDYSSALTDYELPEEFDTSKNYEITFIAKSDSNATQTNIYRKAIEEFEALYPNIKVKLSIEFDYGRIYQNIITNIATGTTPNIAISYPDHVATYLTGDAVVVPLDKVMADEKYGLGGSEVRFDSPTQGEMIEKFLDECKINGKYYALPYMRSSEACYIGEATVSSIPESYFFNITPFTANIKDSDELTVSLCVLPEERPNDVEDAEPVASTLYVSELALYGSSGKGGGTILTVIIVVVIVLAICGLLFLLTRRRKKRVYLNNQVEE